MAGSATMTIGARLMTIEIDGDTYTTEVTSATLAPADNSTVTFAEAAGSVFPCTLAITAVQNLDPDSLWMKSLSAIGTTVPVVLSPLGGTAPSATTPQIQVDAQITKPSDTFLGGDADSDASVRNTFSVSWYVPAFDISTALVTTA